MNASTVQAYRFEDSPSGNVYYRVVAVDLSGACQYSNVVRAACSTGERIMIYPNPVHDQLNILLVAGNSGTCTLLLFDQQGKLLRWFTHTVVKGNNYLVFPVQGLSAGTYTLRLQENGKETNRIIIKN